MEKRLRVIAAYKDAENYIREVRRCTEPDYKQLWTDYVIEPSWKEWAAGQFNEERIRTELERPLIDIERLEEAVGYLKQARVEDLVSRAYRNVDDNLTSPEFDAAICILVNYKLTEAVHGIVGSCVGSNMLLQINPFIENWQQYLPWVIAHEHHHSVWGYDYFFVKGMQSVDLLTSILNEGQADSFAKYICPKLEPAWIRALNQEEEKKQWETMQQHLDKPCIPELHIRYFFGDKDTGTPPYTGYTIGFRIIQSYMRNHPMTSFKELLEKPARVILEESGYKL